MNRLKIWVSFWQPMSPRSTYSFHNNNCRCYLYHPKTRKICLQVFLLSAILDYGNALCFRWQWTGDINLAILFLPAFVESCRGSSQICRLGWLICSRRSANTSRNIQPLSLPTTTKPWWQWLLDPGLCWYGNWLNQNFRLDHVLSPFSATCTVSYKWNEWRFKQRFALA